MTVNMYIKKYNKLTKIPHKINDRRFISLSDKYWYWRLAPNHKSFLFADCGETEDVLLDDLTMKCMYLIRYKVMVSNPITTSKHVYCHLSIIYYILLVPCINKYESCLSPEVTHFNAYASTNSQMFQLYLGEFYFNQMLMILALY